MEISLSQDKKYSYADYLTWADNVRRELFNGIVKLMSPAPARRHQEVSLELCWQFKNYLNNKKCKVYQAPFDVRLPRAGEFSNETIHTVVQPDICIVCDLSKLDKRGCVGAPDLIIEILSEGNVGRDVKEKFEIYQESGVLEYWIVRPYEQTVEVFLLSDKGRFQIRATYVDTDLVPVAIFSDELEIDLSLVFKE